MTSEIRLPEELRSELQRRIDDTEFETLEEYVLFVLREVVENDERREDDRNVRNEQVEDRLEDLGYL
jgi:Arc/MetJ-type ribon-helix-helix transcriptional regulator